LFGEFTTSKSKRGPVAKHKTVTHLPAATSPAPASAPRLTAQLLTVAGELVIVAACVLGLITAGNWLITGYDVRSRAARQPPPMAAREVWHCWWDRYGEICRPVDRGMQIRRYWARDGA
jgi:hypothetical protein